MGLSGGISDQMCSPIQWALKDICGCGSGPTTPTLGGWAATSPSANNPFPVGAPAVAAPAVGVAPVPVTTLTVVAPKPVTAPVVGVAPVVVPTVGVAPVVPPPLSSVVAAVPSPAGCGDDCEGNKNKCSMGMNRLRRAL